MCKVFGVAPGTRSGDKLAVGWTCQEFVGILLLFYGCMHASLLAS